MRDHAAEIIVDIGGDVIEWQRVIGKANKNEALHHANVKLDQTVFGLVDFST